MGVKRKLNKAAEREQTLQEAFDIYIEEKRALNKSQATITSATGSFNKWLDYLLASGYSDSVKEVNVGCVLAFSSHCLNEEMKPTSLNHYLRDIRAFLYWCMEQGMMPSFKVKLVTEQEVIKETYTDEEISRLLVRPSKTATYAEWRSWAIVNWVMATGCRAATICNMRMGDLDFKKAEIYIRKTKTNKAMILPFSQALRNAISEFIRKYRSEASGDDYLFPNVGDAELTVNALKLSIRQYNKSRDVDKTSIHAFRHTFAKNWIRNTGDVFRLQKILGHSTLEMTRRYVNMFSEDLKEGFDTYNPLDKIKKQTSRTQRVQKSDE